MEQWVELLPCPCCGKGNISQSVRDSLWSNVCADCGMQTEKCETFSIACKKWNTRAIDQTEEIIAAAEKVIKRWDSPFWTWDIHTGVYIHELRDAVAKVKTKLKGSDNESIG